MKNKMILMKLSKRNILLEAWQKMKNHLGLWILIMLFIMAFNLAISTVQEKLLDNITSQTILFTVAAYLFQAGINLGMLKIALNIYSGNEAGFSDLLSSFHLLVSYILATIVFFVLLLIAATPGAILLMISISFDFDSLSNLESISSLSFVLPLLLMIVPVIYASIRMQFYDYFLVNEDGGAIEAIKRSIAITRDYVGDLFILGAILSIIILVSMIPLMLGLLISIPLATMVNSQVFLLLKNPIINE